MRTSGWRDVMKKYKLIPEDIVKNMIDFLDEQQFEAAKDNPNTNPEALHKINFCNFMITELLNSNDGVVESNQVIKYTLNPKNDKDWDTILKTFDSFFKGWDKSYQKDDKKDEKKPKSEEKEEWKPRLDDVSEWCTLEEIEEFLKDDPELTDNERFELYYEERERLKRIEAEDKGQSLDEMCKDLGIKRNPGKKK